MAEEKAPRRRRRWIVFALVAGLSGWYVRSRSAPRPPALGRPNPLPAPAPARALDADAAAATTAPIPVTTRPGAVAPEPAAAVDADALSAPASQGTEAAAPPGEPIVDVVDDAGPDGSPDVDTAPAADVLGSTADAPSVEAAVSPVEPVEPAAAYVADDPGSDGIDVPDIGAPRADVLASTADVPSGEAAISPAESVEPAAPDVAVPPANVFASTADAPLAVSPGESVGSPAADIADHQGPASYGRVEVESPPGVTAGPEGGTGEDAPALPRVTTEADSDDTGEVRGAETGSAVAPRFSAAGGEALSDESGLDRTAAGGPAEVPAVEGSGRDRSGVGGPAEVPAVDESGLDLTAVGGSAQGAGADGPAEVSAAGQEVADDAPYEAPEDRNGTSTPPSSWARPSVPPRPRPRPRPHPTRDGEPEQATPAGGFGPTSSEPQEPNDLFTPGAVPAPPAEAQP